MNKKDEYIAWFVDVSKLDNAVISAKIKQLTNWIESERPFGSKYNVVIIPSNENKFSILKTDRDFRENFQGDSNKWLYKVRDRLEDCLTINLSLQNDE